MARKYFLLDEYASRDKWVARLTKIKNDGHLDDMANDIGKLAKPVGGLDKNDFGFEILNKEGHVAVLIDMQFNTYAKIWKVESF